MTQTEFLKNMLNIRSLRAVCRELTLEQLHEAQEKLNTIVAERDEQEQAVQRAQEEQQRHLEEVRAFARERGLDLESLLGASAPAEVEKKSTRGGKRAPRPAKYRYMLDGEEKTWTGQGRMPSVIANAVANGQSLEDFAI